MYLLIGVTNPSKIVVIGVTNPSKIVVIGVTNPSKIVVIGKKKEALASFFFRKELTMYWCTIKEEYIDYLKQFERRIPNIDYGEGKFKPFFAPLFKVDDCVYVTQVTSPKPRHNTLSNQMDFIKYYSSEGKLWGAINLNYMFPVPVAQIVPMTNRNIEHFRSFDTPLQKSKYLKFLDLQLKCVEKLHIDDKAIALYKH